ncbi:MAG: DUF427 domain-containing protein [Solirubrobacteraceae bacterium]
MGWMTGTGPLSKHPGGEFNFSAPAPGATVYLERTPKRVRVEVGGEVIADSRRAFILHESGLQPAYYFPPEDVRTDVLSPTDRHTHCPKKGDASYYTISAGGETVENGAWYYPEPLPAAPESLRGLIAFYFDRMGRWLEEGEEIGVHPRDPYHRIDVVATDRLIRVSLDGEPLAETRRALALFESNLPPRWYIPREDVRCSLTPSDTVTHCPYKGAASYYSVGEHKDLVWYYEQPLAEVGRIAGLLCFYNEKVDLELDGELQARP